jgi:TolB protein
MKSKIWSLILTTSVLVTLLGSAIPAHATFPGKNGRIAFILGPDIYTMNPDGSDVRQLTNLGPDNSASWESWSPDGKLIVFSEFPPPDFNGQLWIMNADGSNQHLLLAEPGVSAVRASFSPDGKTIVFSRSRLPNPEDGSPIVEMYRVGVDGTGLTAITKHEVLGLHDMGPKYSPDGTTILIQGDQRDGIIDAAWLIPADGGKFRLLTPPAIGARRPDWSPDGKKIAFHAHCCNPQNPTITVINADGTGLHELTHNGTDFDAGPHDFDPSWSPEGDAIVFERQTPDSAGIFVLKVGGNAPVQKLSLPVARFRSAQLSHNKHEVIQSEKNGGRIHEIEEGGALPRWGPAPN